MIIIIHSLILITGIGMIYVGAESLVWGGSRLAKRFHVPPIVIGLSIVAFGTSLPEFTVSLYSVLYNVQDIAIGNVIGSNIANVALILAASAVIFPIAADYRGVRTDLLITIAVTILFILLSLDGSIKRVDGILLIIGMGLYLWRLSRIHTVGPEITPTLKEGRVAILIGSVIIGLVVLATGTHLFTKGAVELARIIGISELVIGLTIVAVGTSLPELATSLVAAFRKQSGIVLGNILGSNVFNLMVVMGIVPLIRSVAVPNQARLIQMPIMLGMTLLLIPVLKYQQGIKRIAGAILLCIYVIFTLCMYRLNGY